MDALIKTSDGDLRRAITYLQSASRLHSASRTPLTAASVQEIGGVVPDPVLFALAKALGVEISENDEAVGMDIDTDTVDGFEKVRRAVEVVTREGFSAGQLLIQVRSLSFSYFRQ